MNTKAYDLSAKDYPFDPAVNIRDLHSLERLRAIEDRGVAQMLFELYWVAEAYERDPRAKRAEDAKVRKAAQERAEWLEAIEKSANEGTWGEAGVKLSQMYGGQRLADAIREAKLERRR